MYGTDKSHSMLLVFDDASAYFTMMPRFIYSKTRKGVRYTLIELTLSLLFDQSLGLRNLLDVRYIQAVTILQWF